jgi:ligand-binding sensor domain-containing protein
MMKVKAAVFLATLCLTLSLIACQTQTTTKSGETTLSSELSSERVWINTRYGLTVLSSDGWHSFYEGATVFDIALDPQEKLWAVTREDLSYFDGMKFVVSSKSHKADEIDIDDQDRLWLAGVWAGSGYGVGLYNGEEWTPFALRDYGLTDISAGSFRDIQVDDDGQVWVATSKGLVMFDQQEWKQPVSPVSDQAVHCLAIDDMGKLWVGHGDGLSIFDGASWTTWTGSDMDLMGSVMVESIAFDDDGNAVHATSHPNLLLLSPSLRTPSGYL